jgi:hypothetical protein
MGHAVPERLFREKVVYHHLKWRLFVEMKAENKDVEVLAITVGSVQTTLNRHPLSLFRPTAETSARATMARVGCGRPGVHRYLPQALQAMSLRLLAQSIARMGIINTLKGTAASS